MLKILLDRLEEVPRAERPERALMIRLDRLGRGLGLEALAALAQMDQRFPDHALLNTRVIGESDFLVELADCKHVAKTEALLDALRRYFVGYRIGLDDSRKFIRIALL